MFKRTLFALTVAAAAYVGAVQAQEAATLTLRNGERISAQLIDLGGVGFTVRVNGAERTIPANDVALIDFTGGTMSVDDWNKVSGGQHVLWLRNGEVITGTFYDVGGTAPLRISFKTSAGDRDFSSSEVARIAMSRTDAAVSGTTGSTTARTPASGGGVVVSGKQAWTATGITVRRGENVTFTSNGEIQLSGDSNDIAAPPGSKSGRYASNSPLPRVFAGALIGKVGVNGTPFPIGGTQSTVTMPATGQLFLGVNDDGFEDNVGEFRVEIARAGRR
jgi:hypothetical protein